MLERKKPNKLYDEIIFDNVEGGKTVQILHIGSFDTEPRSFEKIASFMEKHGLLRKFDYHTEIYLSNKNKNKRRFIMLLVLKFFSPNMVTLEFKTFKIQSTTPALAVLPMIANQGKGEVELSTNVVTLSTLRFIIVILMLQTLLG